jgi:AraC family transcriptional regulator
LKAQNDQQRISRVIKHIYKELAKPDPCQLNLDQLSEIAHCSKYHFHRLFAAHVGVNLNQFIRLLRLKKAAYELAFHPELKIIDIAMAADYESHEAFSRAFKRTYQQPPSQFRLQPNWLAWATQHQHKPTSEHIKLNVEIIHFPTTKIAVLEHHGNHLLLNKTIAKFIEWRKASNESPISSSQTFGLAYCDPATTPVDQFRWDVCGSVKAAIKPNQQGVINKTIPGGRCAKITHKGSLDLIEDKIRFLYRHWLLENNETLRDFPGFFHYHNLFPNVPEHELITDFYLPLEN